MLDNHYFQINVNNGRALTSRQGHEHVRVAPPERYFILKILFIPIF
jgi:hypothetical protein